MMNLKPGSFICLEGMDATGKTTVMTELKHRYRAPHQGPAPLPVPMFTHQPSGVGELGKQVYRLTETKEMNPLTRQLLHLASHSEHYDAAIVPWLDGGGSVIMDRCWWSTVAYGYFDGQLSRRMTLESFLDLVQLPAQGNMPQMVALFMNPYQEDRHNTPALHHGYMELAERYADRVVFVPGVSTAKQIEIIKEGARVLGLLQED